MKFVILFGYALSLWYWFFETAPEDEEGDAFIDRVFAFFPPLACSLGIVGWLFLAPMRTYAQLYILVFGLGVSGILWEFKDLKKDIVDKGAGVVGGIVAVFGLLAIFGPGMYYGYQWIAF